MPGGSWPVTDDGSVKMPNGDATEYLDPLHV